MKGPYPWQILTVVGVDANNGIYHVAYAIVESENTTSWLWFLEYLGDDLDNHANTNFTFISDRQKGLIPAINQLFPGAEHRYCLCHIHENMRSKLRGDLYKDMLWKCASATTVHFFNKDMDEIKQKDVGLYNWMQQIPPKHWTRSHFSGKF
ncbi:putative MULE transposase domain-containing protein [Helianthus annuus]|nr:putative MULE transposase domain-containing protein [Helianthus annuus]